MPQAAKGEQPSRKDGSCEPAGNPGRSRQFEIAFAEVAVPLPQALGVGGAQVLTLALGRGGDHQAHDEAVEAQSLGEDEDEDHADE
eukprot:CAMPEP_0203945818 /NCGR_PEP_ID=MMETSP0359-20131031/81252_1 /ASSEMBLY_ACC=CAM_ASM_000338 /TAXON_ID=268821 /ORGANISM="Scrippsiella Hangoei, Strain SHTV-5" /LENGTH=85 /DNA_ID=CAMNT_0050877033 /DNA_START=31 /DNA_END=286 /DNA_ORIENTATION=+